MPGAGRRAVPCRAWCVVPGACAREKGAQFPRVSGQRAVPSALHVRARSLSVSLCVCVSLSLSLSACLSRALSPGPCFGAASEASPRLRTLLLSRGPKNAWVGGGNHGARSGGRAAGGRRAGGGGCVQTRERTALPKQAARGSAAGHALGSKGSISPSARCVISSPAPITSTSRAGAPPTSGAPRLAAMLRGRSRAAPPAACRGEYCAFPRHPDVAIPKPNWSWRPRLGPAESNPARRRWWAPSCPWRGPQRAGNHRRGWPRGSPRSPRSPRWLPATRSPGAPGNDATQFVEVDREKPQALRQKLLLPSCTPSPCWVLAAPPARLPSLFATTTACKRGGGVWALYGRVE